MRSKIEVDLCPKTLKPKGQKVTAILHFTTDTAYHLKFGFAGEGREGTDKCDAIIFSSIVQARIKKVMTNNYLFL